MSFRRALIGLGGLASLLACGCPATAPQGAPSPPGAPAPSASPNPEPTPPERPTPTYSYFPAQAYADVEVPETGRVGEPVSLVLHFIAADGCVSASAASAEVDDKYRSVRISGMLAANTTLGIGCTALVHYPTRTVTFTPQAAGPYRIPVLIAPSSAKGGAAARLKALFTEDQLRIIKGPVEVTFTVDVR